MSDGLKVCNRQAGRYQPQRDVEWGDSVILHRPSISRASIRSHGNICSQQLRGDGYWRSCLVQSSMFKWRCLSHVSAHRGSRREGRVVAVSLVFGGCCHAVMVTGVSWLISATLALASVPDRLEDHKILEFGLNVWNFSLNE